MSGVNQYVWIYALLDGTSVDLCVSGVNIFFDESLHNSTAISAGASNGSTLYCGSSHAGSLPTKLIGRLLVNETTAGVWSSSPTEVSLLPTLTITTTEWSSFTMTGSWTANTSYSGQWRRVGANIEIMGTVSTTGAPTAAILSVNIPSGLSMSPSAGLPVGTARPVNAVPTSWFAQAVINNPTSLVFDVPVTSLYTGTQYPFTGPITQLVPFTWGNNCGLAFQVSAPISGWSAYGP